MVVGYSHRFHWVRSGTDLRRVLNSLSKTDYRRLWESMFRQLQEMYGERFRTAEVPTGRLREKQRADVIREFGGDPRPLIRGLDLRNGRGDPVKTQPQFGPSLWGPDGTKYAIRQIRRSGKSAEFGTRHPRARLLNYGGDIGRSRYSISKGYFYFTKRVPGRRRKTGGRGLYLRWWVRVGEPWFKKFTKDSGFKMPPRPIFQIPDEKELEMFRKVFIPFWKVEWHKAVRGGTFIGGRNISMPMPQRRIM